MIARLTKWWRARRTQPEPERPADSAPRVSTAPPDPPRLPGPTRGIQRGCEVLDEEDLRAARKARQDRADAERAFHLDRLYREGKW